MAEYRGARIFRFGLLTADRSSHRSPKQDLLRLFLLGLAELQAIPDTMLSDAAIDITPIDYAADAWVKIGLDPQATGRYHINANQSLKLNALLDAFRDAGQPIATVSEAEFKTRQRQHTALGDAGRIARLALDRLLSTGQEGHDKTYDIFLSTGAHFDSRRSEQQLGYRCPDPSRDYMVRLIQNALDGGWS